MVPTGVDPSAQPKPKTALVARAACRPCAPPDSRMPWVGFRVVLSVEGVRRQRWLAELAADPDRAFARRSLSLGGHVTTRDNMGKQIKATSLDELPEEFKLIGINFFVSGAQAQRVTDDVLEGLSRLEQLEYLNLRATRVGDGVTHHVRDCLGLKYLNLHATGVTDQGLPPVAKLPNLELLDVGWNPRITDEGLQLLKPAAQLKTINLFSTRITDVGLMHLGEISTLRLIELKNKSISSAAIDRLQQQLPDATILR